MQMESNWPVGPRSWIEKTVVEQDALLKGVRSKILGLKSVKQDVGLERVWMNKMMC